MDTNFFWWHDDGFVIWVCGFEMDHIVDDAEDFEGNFSFICESDDDIAGVGMILLSNDGDISADDGGLCHGVSFDF